jgi:DNA-binding transcriptional ArsR family regulator
MGTTKKEEFTLQDNRIAEFAKAIAHPARIAILRLLLNKNSCICGDIVDHLPLAQSTVSQHLKELKSAGIIQGNVEGTSVCYCIDEKVLGKLKSYFGKLESKIKSKCC